MVFFGMCKNLPYVKGLAAVLRVVQEDGYAAYRLLVVSYLFDVICWLFFLTAVASCELLPGICISCRVMLIVTPIQPDALHMPPPCYPTCCIGVSAAVPLNVPGVSI
jgi:hypothetical protein